MALTGNQRRHLRALGHSLDPVIQVGKHGITPAVMRATDEALETHELVKVKVLAECPDDRDAVAEALSAATRSEVAQALGRTMLLYRRHPKKPKVELPKPKKTPPALP